MSTTDSSRETLKVIGQRVQKARQAKGISQTTLSVQLGVSWPTISRLERGIGKTLDLDRLHDVAEVLGVRVEDLIRDAA